MQKIWVCIQYQRKCSLFVLTWSADHRLSWTGVAGTGGIRIGSPAVITASRRTASTAEASSLIVFIAIQRPRWTASRLSRYSRFCAGERKDDDYPFEELRLDVLVSSSRRTSGPVRVQRNSVEAVRVDPALCSGHGGLTHRALPWRAAAEALVCEICWMTAASVWSWPLPPAARPRFAWPFVSSGLAHRSTVGQFCRPIATSAFLRRFEARMNDSKSRRAGR